MVAKQVGVLDGEDYLLTGVTGSPDDAVVSQTDLDTFARQLVATGARG
ncbi:hypothetical protein [Actinospica robiniae]|nr:hypothetical protein [Actinospica robiniae]